MNAKTDSRKGRSSKLMASLLVSLIFGPIYTSAQSSYTGGKGDGYTKASLTQLQVSIDESDLLKWKVYPQPAISGEFLMIEFPVLLITTSFQLFDLNGRLLLEQEAKAGTNELRIVMEKIPPGTYLLSANINEELIQSKLIVTR